jgi:hypothetical membrane protein
MTKREKTILIILTVLNAVVLLGQIYPEGAPPFAAVVNIVFLAASLIYFISRFSSKDKS